VVRRRDTLPASGKDRPLPRPPLSTTLRRRSRRGEMSDVDVAAETLKERQEVGGATGRDGRNNGVGLWPCTPGRPIIKNLRSRPSRGGLNALRR
jgi:hypothetical protein